MASPETLREITVAQMEAFADSPDDEMSQTLVLDAIDVEIRAAYADAREHAITAFLSIIAGGFSEHVVMWNYTKLRDYLSQKAGFKVASLPVPVEDERHE
jgi:hypothetical protein